MTAGQDEGEEWTENASEVVQIFKVSKERFCILFNCLKDLDKIFVLKLLPIMSRSRVYSWNYTLKNYGCYNYSIFETNRMPLGDMRSYQ